MQTLQSNLQKPFKRHVDQIVMLHQPLVIEERHGGIFDISEYEFINRLAKTWQKTWRQRRPCRCQEDLVAGARREGGTWSALGRALSPACRSHPLPEKLVFSALWLSNEHLCISLQFCQESIHLQSSAEIFNNIYQHRRAVLIDEVLSEISNPITSIHPTQSHI